VRQTRVPLRFADKCIIYVRTLICDAPAEHIGHSTVRSLLGEDNEMFRKMLARKIRVLRMSMHVKSECCIATYHTTIPKCEDMPASEPNPHTAELQPRLMRGSCPTMEKGRGPACCPLAGGLAGCQCTCLMARWRLQCAHCSGVTRKCTRDSNEWRT
jgi:hypothetical protein